MRAARLAVLFACVALMPSCYQNTEYTPQPRMKAAPYLSEVVVRRHWVQDVDEILKSCTKLHNGGTYVGCADWRQEGGVIVCDVYVQQPTDFNDVARLATLGHELLHCLGATHD